MVSDRIRFHFDEHIPKAVATALRRRSIDVTMPLDAGLLEASDLLHLDYARLTGRVMVTFDSDFLQLHSTGIEHAGIAFVGHRSRSIGQLIKMLILFYEAFLPHEMTNRLEYL